jgi:nucleoside-diphosphate-sugar epimerase
MVTHHNSTLQFPPRVVVLGGTGFLGKTLIDLILKPAGVETVSLGSAQINLLEDDSVEALGKAVREGDALVFASALTPDKGKDARTAMKNLAMGEHVSAFVESSKCSHVIYISSDVVYEDDANPVRETACTSPSTLYGLMHLMRERMLQVAVQKPKIPLLLLRSTAMYGAGDTHNSYGPNRFLRTATKDRQIGLFGQGEEQRDHLWVHDCARLIGESLRHRTAGALNAATGSSVSFVEVAQTVAGIVGGEVQIKGQPRSGPVTHRHFDIKETIKAFPSFQFASLHNGLVEAAKRL